MIKPALKFATVAALVIIYAIVASGVVLGADETAAAPAATSAGGGIPAELVGTIIAGALASWGTYKLGQKTVRVEPQPLEIAAAKEYALASDLRKLEQKFDDYREKTHAEIDNMESRLQKRLDQIVPKVERILGILEGQGVINNN